MNLFDEMRNDDGRVERPGFVLAKPACRKVEFCPRMATFAAAIIGRLSDVRNLL